MIVKYPETSSGFFLTFEDYFNFEGLLIFNRMVYLENIVFACF